MPSMANTPISDDGRLPGEAVSPIPSTTFYNTEAKKNSQLAASPTPSASIILVSPTNKVLLLHRVSTSSTFPSAHVFPGGVLEPADGEVALGSTNPARHRDSMAYRACAIRELFEESGILLARQSSTSAELLSLSVETRTKGRRDIHGNKTNITSWLSQCSLSAVLDTESLLPFTRWISPVTMPKRFTSQIYLYFLPTSGQAHEFHAIADDIETIAAEWSYASDWLERAQKGLIVLHATQCLLLYLVGKFLREEVSTKGTSISDLETQRQKLRAFTRSGQSPWADRIISPRAIGLTKKDGRTVLGLDWPGPELHGVEGIVGDEEHVILARYVRNVPRDIEVALRIRNKQQYGDKDRRDISKL